MGHLSLTSGALVILSIVTGCGGGAGGGGGGDGGGSDAGGSMDAATLDDGGPSTDEVCNGIDDNHDGRVDEGCACVVGETQPCYPGDRAVAGVGECRLGTQECIETGIEFGSWGACTGAEPPGDELCDGLDNDCDGTVDNGCACADGDSRPCYEGPAGTSGVGVCADGTQGCEAGPGGVGSTYGACAGSVVPGTEECNGLDDNCDGTVDEGCTCSEGDTRSCYSGPAGTEGVGPCVAGTQSCVSMGGVLGWGPCAGAVLPAGEMCNGIDDDCDGTADDGCACLPGDSRDCYSGPAGTAGVGVCVGGTQSCEAGPGGVGSDWGACTGEHLPSAELCNGVDDDCDGMLDEGCTCTPGTDADCYSGPAGTAGVGPCRAGRHTCVMDADGTTRWGTCVGEVLPMADICGDGVDNNCNGTVDESCICPPGTIRSCYSGPAGTEGVGTCASGRQSCSSSGWGPCVGEVWPGPEVCDGLDNDCDGTRDDGCDCVPGSARACYGGPPATRGVGLCRDGTQSCVSGPGGVGSSWGACSGYVGPAAEVCDGVDNDCDTMVDEGCACSTGDTRACYTGPAGTSGVGICHDGSQSCIVSGGTASWGTCTGAVTPGTETCDGRDEDCDGSIDEGVCMVPPTVMCPPPATTTALVPVTLTATASDADGVIVSVMWTLVSAPAGASGTFSSPTSLTTSFTPNLVGVYTVRLTVTDNDGLTATCTTTVTARGLGLRIEISWNTDFSDEDLHLLRMASGLPWFNNPNDCYYANRTPSWDAAGTADDPRLDIDDVDGYGPENINIDSPVVGSTYRVGVHYYSDHGAGPTTVTVRIFCGDISVVPVATYSRLLSNGAGVPDSNDFWRVADVAWLAGDTCTVTTLGTLTTGGTARTTP